MGEVVQSEDDVIITAGQKVGGGNGDLIFRTNGGTERARITSAGVGSGLLSAGTNTLSVPISQTGHGFTVGQAVRYDAGAAAFVLSQADSSAHAVVVGLVSAVVDVNTFTVQMGGRITGIPFTLSAGTDYYLDPAVQGGLTATAPTAVGQVVRKVLEADSSSSGFMLNAGSTVVAAAPVYRLPWKLLDDATALIVKDPLVKFVVESWMNGMKLVGVVFTVTTAPVTTIPLIGLKKNGTDMLSTKVGIDVGEFSSETAATPPVISAGQATVATGDIIDIYCSQVGTGANGALVTPAFS